jgi:broad specificity phosphatase PhoE
LNQLNERGNLRNQYFVMRHGHSEANRQGIIVSHPRNGCDNYGLTGMGRKQVDQSLDQNNQLDSDVVLICSDFRRARETAEIVRQRLGCKSPLLDPRLRERNFGNLELGDDSSYDDVWREDALDADSELNHVESVNQVMFRVTAVIAEYETNYSAASILLVSHGDALQLLQTAFLKKPASQHRDLRHLQTAEIRQLLLV